MKVGDQVKIASAEHPWNGDIGVIVECWHLAGGNWTVELQTTAPGQRVAVYEDELVVIGSSFLP